MKIVTTPMCKDVLELAGVREFDVNLDPDSTDYDIAVVLSETDTNINSVKVKLNTFYQIKTSIEMLREIFETDEVEYDPKDYIYHGVNKSENRKIKVKVYSNFLRDIIDDLGFDVVRDDEYYHYLVYPDYIKDEILEEILKMGDRVVEVPSHKNTPKNPIKRAELRYKLLEKKLCMKP
jgi:segregation and condensation protein B